MTSEWVSRPRLVARPRLAGYILVRNVIERGDADARRRRSAAATER